MKASAIVRIVTSSLVILVLTSILVFFLGIRIGFIPDIAIASSTPESAASQTNEMTFLFSADEVSSLDIEWAAGNIFLYADDRQDIAIFETQTAKHPYCVVYDHQKQKIAIQFQEEVFPFGFGIYNTPEKDLYIYVPQDWICRSLEIEAAASHITMNSMTIDHMEFDGASGQCELTNCQIDSLDIDTASGDVTFSGTLNTLDFDAASASFTAAFANIPSQLDMDGMSGKLDIILPEDCGYAVRMEGLSRSFQSEFGNALVHGDGRCQINVDGLNCGVTIRKAATAAS